MQSLPHTVTTSFIIRYHKYENGKLLKIYTADHLRVGSFGKNGIGSSKVFRDEYFKQQKEFTKLFKTHGNNLAKALKKINNQSTPVKDKDAGMDKGRYVNDTWRRASGFAYSIPRFWEFHGYAKKTPKVLALKAAHGLTWQDVMTECIMLYPAEIIEKLERNGDATFFKYAYESKTHKYDNPEERLDEYFIHERHKTPPPSYIILGKMKHAIKKEERRDMDKEILPALQNVHGDNTKVILLHNTTLGQQKPEDGSTGNLIASPKALKFMELILKIESGTYRPKYNI